MSKCPKCGEFIDWSNPNVHYGSGHTCDPEVLKSHKLFIKLQSENVLCPHCKKTLDNGDLYYEFCSHCRKELSAFFEELSDKLEKENEL